MKPRIITFISILAAYPLAASPRIGSNSISMRHDMLLMRDASAIESNVMTWPWPLGRSTPNFGSKIEDAIEQFSVSYAKESTMGFRPVEASLSLASERLPFRSFGYQPREQFEVKISRSWLGEWTAGNLNFTFADNPLDRDELRFDGSYFSVAAGNWIVSIDQVDRWWGPGWDGSLILSNNARPFPALSLMRISPDPFENKWLNWIGPWTFNTFMGQLDNDEEDRPGSDARLFGIRIDFTPFGWKHLDIGLSRTAQWAGDGRPGGLDTFWRLLMGEDNRVNGVTLENEPGNQLAGIDYRIRYPWFNVAHYAQLTGEDEETFLPDANMLLVGVETWGELKSLNATWRAYSEWADTRAGYLRRDPGPSRDFNTAYNHGIYQTGYRRKGQSIGHAMDGDGIMRSIGFFIIQENGNSWGGKVRNYSINRDGRGPNSISIDPLEGSSIELFGELTSMPFLKSQQVIEIKGSMDLKLNFGIHYISEDNTKTGESSSDIGGHLSISTSY